MRATKRCPATSQETNQNCSLSSSTSCVHPGHNRKSPVKKAAIRRVLHLLFEGAPSKLRLGGFFFGRSLGFAACPPSPDFWNWKRSKMLARQNRESGRARFSQACPERTRRVPKQQARRTNAPIRRNYHWP